MMCRSSRAKGSAAFVALKGGQAAWYAAASCLVGSAGQEIVVF